MRSRHLTLTWTVTAALALAVGCGSDDNTGDKQPPDKSSVGQELKSDKLRISSPDVPDAELEQLVAGNADFAFDLYRALRADTEYDGENLFYSPHSISIALGMLQAGAKGNTATEIAEAMSFDLDDARLHPAFNLLDLELDSRGEGAKGSDASEPFRLHIVNQAWGQQGFDFHSSYLDALALHYGAGLRLVDFAGDAEDARLTINGWVEQQTEDRIKDLLPEGSISVDTRMVLTNAIYFNAAWAQPFDKNATIDRDFALLDGSKKAVPTMHQQASFRYAEGGSYQAIELPYDGDELAMVIIAPTAGSFDGFEQGLDAATVGEVLSSLTPHEISLALPSFEYATPVGLKDPLQALGMVDAFDGSQADLSGIADPPPTLFVKDVLHKAFVKLNEAGTEAAAATAVIIDTESAGPPSKNFAVDRPFVFLIRDTATGAILFVGRVLDPAA